MSEKVPLKRIRDLVFYRGRVALAPIVETNLKIWRGVAQPNVSGVATFNVTDDGLVTGNAIFTNLTDRNLCSIFATAEKDTGTIGQIPLDSIKARPVGAKQVTVNLVESQNTNVVLGGNVEGLELDSTSNTDTYVHLLIIGT